VQQRARRRSESGGLRDHVRVLRRRMWLILAAVVLITGSAVFLTLRQKPLYQSSSQVLLKYQNLAANLTGIQDFSGVYQDPTRIAETQTKIATSPGVAKLTIKAASLAGMTPGEFLAHAAVSVEPDSDILDFQFTDRSPDRAVRIATEFARQYIVYRKALDTAAIALALSEAEARINQLKAANQTNSTLYERLVESEQQLRTMEALQTANASVLREADGAAKIQPRPVRNGILGFFLGLMLGLGLAFFREALDTRLRSASEVGERLGLPLLARLPEPPRPLRTRQRLVMRDKPQSGQAEAFRMLRTNLEFVNLERGARTIMVVSALQGEGKTTTAANLAVALARAGRRVALVDLDLRRPTLHNYFQLGIQPGLTDVALGHAGLDEAIARVALTAANEGESERTDDPVARAAEAGTAALTNGRPKVDGWLEVLPAGLIPPDPGEFVNTHALTELLRDLRERADLVIIDTPPLLSVGDTMVLSAHVDAMIVVARISLIRRPSITELRRVLDSCRASKLGFVLAAADLEEGYGYGTYSYSYDGYTTPREVEPERTR
jgi:succinoglycan biosynthesis transport protein ExoP